MIERTTVRLPGELLRRAKRKAATEGRTLTALIEEGLRLILSETRANPPMPHNEPPVSTARGGLRPGVNLNDLSRLQEEEDLKYLERLNRFE